MKSSYIVLGCFMVAVLNFPVLGQAPLNTIEDGDYDPTGLEISHVPADVMDTYQTEYKKPTEVNWYGFPPFANETEWYGYDPKLTTASNPRNYIVKFKMDNVQHTVIYCKTGKKIATHRALNVALPKVIVNTLSHGKYKNWTLAKEKEEIIKEADKKDIVYKVKVEREKERHILYFDSLGKLILDKKIV
jgi:hypothetical protein